MNHPIDAKRRLPTFARADRQPEHFIPAQLDTEHSRRIMERLTRKWLSAPRAEGL